MYSNLPERATFEATPGSEKPPEVKF
jgi:LemA protein